MHKENISILFLFFGRTFVLCNWFIIQSKVPDSIFIYSVWLPYFLHMKKKLRKTSELSANLWEIHTIRLVLHCPNLKPTPFPVTYLSFSKFKCLYFLAQASISFLNYRSITIIYLFDWLDMLILITKLALSCPLGQMPYAHSNSFDNHGADYAIPWWLVDNCK